MLRAMSKNLYKNEIVLDIGANIGNHTLYLARKTGCQVISFEPNPDLHIPLEKSIIYNNLESSITLIKKGVGSSIGKGAFLKANPQNLGAQSITLIENELLEDETAFEITTLDSFIFKDTIKAIKIDVEGMEIDVLKGAVKTILKHKPDLFIEAQALEDYKKISGYLSDIHYVYWGTYNATPTHHFTHETNLNKEKIKQRLYEEGVLTYHWHEEREELKKQLKNIRTQFERTALKTKPYNNQEDFLFGTFLDKNHKNGSYTIQAERALGLDFSLPDDKA